MFWPLPHYSFSVRCCPNIITETYYDRKYADGTHKEWYTSAKYDDRNTGYTIGLYFADGLLFFASAYHAGEADAVTFYF